MNAAKLSEIIGVFDGLSTMGLMGILVYFLYQNYNKKDSESDDKTNKILEQHEVHFKSMLEQVKDSFAEILEMKDSYIKELKEINDGKDIMLDKMIEKHDVYHQASVDSRRETLDMSRQNNTVIEAFTVEIKKSNEQHNATNTLIKATNKIIKDVIGKEATSE
ncbi:MAG: hypothetical protein HRU12_08375 [Phaeodactylibacter sp.]|nr:hypothetical protein [Phaeodactylibacter sp.]